MSRKFFVEERRNKIIEILNEQKRVKVLELSKIFSVTEDLIRKDLNVLEAQSKLKRTHGGAIINTKMSEIVPYRERIQAINQNVGFAKTAAKYVEDGETIFIEASSFTYPMFKELREKKDLTIVTNALYGLVDILPTANLIHTGGSIHKIDEAAYGNLTNCSIKQIYYDKCFLSLAGVTKDFKITASLEDGVLLKKAAMSNSKEIITLIPSDKWEHHGIYKVASINGINVVISDTKDQDIINYLENNDIKHLIPAD